MSALTNKSEFSEKRAEAARSARKKRIIFAVIFALVVVVAAIGIAAVNTSPLNNSDGSVESSETVEDLNMQTVKDSRGRSVKVPIDPQNIAIMDSFSGELAVMIGAGSRMCGVPQGVKSDAILQQIYPELNLLTSLSGNAVNIETLMSFECDVAIVKSTMSNDELAKLERMDIPYIVVAYTTFSEQINAIRLVGKVCGDECSASAENLATYYEQVAADVSSRVESVAEDEHVRVYHSINNALLTDSKNSLGADWISIAGCMDVSSGASATSGTDYNATLEQVFVWNPDLIVCNSVDALQEITTDQKWAALPAVQRGDVKNIPIGATRWGQRGSVETALAMLWLGCEAYPELFSDVDLKQITVSYYKEYLGVDIDDETYDMIVSGVGIRSGGNGGDGSGGGNGGGGR